MAEKAKLLIEIENFRKIRTERIYCTDKTELIKSLLAYLGKVNLFTNPNAWKGPDLEYDLTVFNAAPLPDRVRTQML